MKDQDLWTGFYKQDEAPTWQKEFIWYLRKFQVHLTLDCCLEHTQRIRTSAAFGQNVSIINKAETLHFTSVCKLETSASNFRSNYFLVHV